jgi:hypothetical protein
MCYILSDVSYIPAYVSIRAVVLIYIPVDYR